MGGAKFDMCSVTDADVEKTTPPLHRGYRCTQLASQQDLHHEL